MKEIYEFRVREKYAKEFLPADLGECKMNLVRIVFAEKDTELFQQIQCLTKFVQERDNRFLFFGWGIQRIYSKSEISKAELLLLKIKRTFEPSGEECGTEFDKTHVCEYCGTGVRQISDLQLAYNSIPKSVDISRTISSEVIISEQMKDILEKNSIKGYEIKPISSLSKKTLLIRYHQLFVKAKVKINQNTITGNDTFDYDIGNTYRCRNGHTAGLDILSELAVDRNSWDGSDIVATEQLFGVNRSLLRTYPLIAISQKLYRALSASQIKGFSVEVVHLIP